MTVEFYDTHITSQLNSFTNFCFLCGFFLILLKDIFSGFVVLYSLIFLELNYLAKLVLNSVITIIIDFNLFFTTNFLIISLNSLFNADNFTLFNPHRISPRLIFPQPLPRTL